MVAKSKKRRAVIVDGLRTPFVKSNTAFRNLSALDLARYCVSELLQRVNVSPTQIDSVIYGQVIPSLDAPNIAREIVVGTNIPNTSDAYTVNRACATSYQTTINAIQHIESGSSECVIAGGADSASQVPLKISEHLRETLMSFENNKPWKDILRSIADLNVSDLAPKAPAVKEPSTGLSMGESCEKMAKENGISRSEQDDYAHKSHKLAADAWNSGKYSEDVMTLYPPGDFDHYVKCDSLVRFDSDRADYDKLKPAFDNKYGTLTPGNSSSLSDGASALILMSEELANQLNLEPLGWIKSYHFSAVDPFKQLLIGPIFAIPKALEKAKMSWNELDLIDMHEAFAAQVLSVLKVFQNEEFAQEKFDLEGVSHDFDLNKFNVNGGSIALGHPFAATGARQLMQSFRELKRRNKKTALCSACAAGGLSSALILEAA